ncbi:MAG: 3',5'-cyclic-nucleotide phosphodiesterase (PDEase) (3':5'-CNP), partial [Chaenotheca gracillima]
DAVKVERESTTGKFEEVAPYVSGKRGREVFINGDADYGVWTAGQVIGLIHDIPTCDALVKRIEKDAIDTLSRASSLIIEGDQKPVTTTGTRGENTETPGATLWGFGKSKL